MTLEGEEIIRDFKDLKDWQYATHRVLPANKAQRGDLSRRSRYLGVLFIINPGVRTGIQPAGLWTASAKKEASLNTIWDCATIPDRGAPSSPTFISFFFARAHSVELKRESCAIQPVQVVLSLGGPEYPQRIVVHLEMLRFPLDKVWFREACW